MKKEETSKILYLDWNIFAYFFENKLNWLKNRIDRLKEAGIIVIPFASEHINEAANIKNLPDEDKRKIINERLKFISEICSNLYFVNDIVDTGFRFESPFSVYSTLNEVNSKESDLKSILSYDLLKMSRRMLKIESSILNNCKPEKVVEELDKIIHSDENREKYIRNTDKDVSIYGLIKGSLEIMNNASKNTPIYAIMNNKKYSKLNNYIVMMFTILDFLGFWADKKSTYNRGSIYVDSRHAFNGSFADFLISEDKRFCMKTRVVYHEFNIHTKILHLNDDAHLIDKLLNNLY